MIFIVIMMIFIIGCSKKVDLIGTWNSNGKSYTFNGDGTCTKVVNSTSYSCTYDEKDGVVNIYLTNDPTNVYESGQINPDLIIIGSDVYQKSE